MFMGLCIAIFGMVTNSMHKFAEMAWNGSRLVFMKLAHGLCGFGTICFA